MITSTLGHRFGRGAFQGHASVANVCPWPQPRWESRMWVNCGGLMPCRCVLGPNGLSTGPPTVNPRLAGPSSPRERIMSLSSYDEMPKGLPHPMESSLVRWAATVRMIQAVGPRRFHFVAGESGSPSHSRLNNTLCECSRYNDAILASVANFCHPANLNLNAEREGERIGTAKHQRAQGYHCT